MSCFSIPNLGIENHRSTDIGPASERGLRLWKYQKVIHSTKFYDSNWLMDFFRLSRYLIDFRKGRTTEAEDEIQSMNDLVTEYGDFFTFRVNGTESNGVDDTDASISHSFGEAGDHVVSTPLISYLNNVSTSCPSFRLRHPMAPIYKIRGILT